MPATDLDVQLTTERDHLGASRAALRRMRERAEALYATGDQVAGDAYGAESLGRALSRRIAELADDPDTPIFFGRLHFTEVTGSADEPAGGDFHIGRRHVTDERGEPMVLDWRAPISRAFYQASARDPQGVQVRRRFGFAAGTLTSFEDERLDRGEELGTASRILTTEIERPRVGPMRDIVATIQPEQDELVRAAIEESICVQGAPGTGKTAVGLHRAAFLLYQYREPLRRPGVLILGPNRAFLHYIGAVLPTLGEYSVEQSTVEDLVSRVVVRGEDPPAATVLKHDVRMAAVLRNAIRGYVRKPTEPVVVPDGSYRWRIPAEALRRVVDDVRREDLPHAVGRERVRARVAALVQRQSEARRGDSPGETWLRRVGRSKPVAGFLDAVWPAVTPEALVFGLLSSAEALAAAADGILDPAEQAALLWPRPPRSVGAARWSVADALLLDEAAGLVDRRQSFGHVIVDEAQDLSPMQCRAVARRCEHGSLTLLGDLAQGTAPWAATDWAATLGHLGKPAARVVPLTLGFRVPGAVLDLANRLLPALAVDVPAARSLRHDGWLAIRQVSDVDTAVVAAVREALELEGSVAVIAADATTERLASALRRAGIAASGAEDEARVTVLPAALAKGLEYDHVIVVEPAEIVDAEPRGLHRLYVVLTRAVSRLAVVHARPLPAQLT
jgi:DNA helicase IV